MKETRHLETLTVRRENSYNGGSFSADSTSFWKNFPLIVMDMRIIM